MINKIKEIISENLGCEIEEITLDTNLVSDLNADSLDIVEISMAIEDEFGVKIADEDFEKIRTIKDIVEYIENHDK